MPAIGVTIDTLQVRWDVIAIATHPLAKEKLALKASEELLIALDFVIFPWY